MSRQRDFSFFRIPLKDRRRAARLRAVLNPMIQLADLPNSLRVRDSNDDVNIFFLFKNYFVVIFVFVFIVSNWQKRTWL